MTPTLPPVTTAACNAGLGETGISTYTSRALGAIDLTCGDSSNGHVHIRERHQNDWQQVVDIAGGGGNWDDLMEFITGQAVAAPSAGYPKDIGSGKSCFTPPAAIIDSSGVVGEDLDADSDHLPEQQEGHEVDSDSGCPRVLTVAD